ncbi:MAG: glycosyltransferase family 2 protein, partial [Cyanothece sp. SIO1E1]|nr:glycosyltransferase family 2 protein [Cyanothece sp. SIO1E1]
GTFNRWTGSLKHQATGITSHPTQSQTITSRWVSGCSLILNLAQFEHCPQFDSHYFLYYEDADLCERYYQQGYEIAVTTDSLVTHAVSSLTQKNLQSKFQHATYSKLYFLKQHGTTLALMLNLLYMLMLMVRLSPTQPAAAVGRWQGWWQFVQRDLLRQSQSA